MFKKMLLVTIALPAMVIFNFKIISLSSAGYIYPSVQKVNKPGMIVVPGAGSPDNNSNFYFIGRVEKAAEVHRAFPDVPILCIGRYDGKYYREPMELKSALINKSVPEPIILTDSCGYNTFDSVLRLKEKYSGYDLLIISQPLHLERMIFSAGRMGVVAKGLAVTEDYPYRMPRYFRVREVISRLRMTASLTGYRIYSLFS